jgi:hypothetical protein
MELQTPPPVSTGNESDEALKGGKGLPSSVHEATPMQMQPDRGDSRVPVRLSEVEKDFPALKIRGNDGSAHILVRTDPVAPLDVQLPRDLEVRRTRQQFSYLVKQGSFATPEGGKRFDPEQIAKGLETQLNYWGSENWELMHAEVSWADGTYRFIFKKPQ